MSETVSETVRESLARMRAANRSAVAGSMELFSPHDQVGVLERVFTCNGCGTHIAVGPCWEHIDPAGFVGAVCGCLTPAVLPMDTATDGGCGDEGRAGTGQQTGRDDGERSWERAMEQQGSWKAAR